MISIYIIPLLVAMFLAINMGGSGTAPSFSAAYGANLIRKDLIPGIFGLFVFAGALIAGERVIHTVGGAVLPAEHVGMVMSVIVLGAVGLALLFSNLLRVPQSTSQATIFALAGPAIYLDVLETRMLFMEIIPTWFITPVLAFAVAYVCGRWVYLPLRGYLKPILDFFRKHGMLRWFVIATSCYVAFAIGSNNMANAAAPVLIMASNMLYVDAGSANYMLLMLIVVCMLAPLFGIGSSLLGYRVLQTTGKGISQFGPLGASYIAFITASILLISSVWRGIPTSLVQMNTAAIIALGMLKTGHKNVLRTAPLKKIFSIWVISPLIAFLLSLLFTWAADVSGILY